MSTYFKNNLHVAAIVFSLGYWIFPVSTAQATGLYCKVDRTEVVLSTDSQKNYVTYEFGGDDVGKGCPRIFTNFGFSTSTCPHPSTEGHPFSRSISLGMGSVYANPTFNDFVPNQPQYARIYYTDDTLYIDKYLSGVPKPGVPYAECPTIHVIQPNSSFHLGNRISCLASPHANEYVVGEVATLKVSAGGRGGGELRLDRGCRHFVSRSRW